MLNLILQSDVAGEMNFGYERAVSPSLFFSFPTASLSLSLPFPVVFKIYASSCLNVYNLP